MNDFLILLLLYAIAGTAIALIARRYGTKDDVDYFIAGRNVSGLISALTYAATTYSAFMMVGLVGLSYATGVGAAAFELFYLVGTLFLLSYYSPKLWKLSKETNSVSPAELIGHRFGRRTAVAIAIVCIIALIPYTASQLIGVSLIITKLSNLSYISAIFISATLIALWAFIGGLRGVAWTDAIQGIIMLLAAMAALIYVFNMNPKFFDEVSVLKDLLIVPNKIWTPMRFLSLTIPWFFFALTNPQVLQRTFIPKDEKALKKMVIYFGIFGLIYTVIVTLLGLMLRTMTAFNLFPLVKDRDMVTPTLLSIMPEGVALFVTLSIIAAAITTANSIVLSLSSMVARDIAKKRYIGQISVVALTIFVGIFALLRPSYIVELSVMSSTILLSVLPLIFAIFHSRYKKGFASLSTAFAIAIVLSYMRYPLTPLVTLAIGAFVLIAENRIK